MLSEQQFLSLMWQTINQTAWEAEQKATQALNKRLYIYEALAYAGLAALFAAGYAATVIIRGDSMPVAYVFALILFTAAFFIEKSLNVEN